MGFSRVLHCFTDASSGDSRKKNQLGNRARGGKETPNRVAPAVAPKPASAAAPVTGAALSTRPGVAMVGYPSTSQPPTTADGEPEPWTVAAVARRTSLLSAELAEKRSQVSKGYGGIAEEANSTSGSNFGSDVRAKSPFGPSFGVDIRATEFFKLPTVDLDLRAQARAAKEREEMMETEEVEEWYERGAKLRSSKAEL